MKELLGLIEQTPPFKLSLAEVNAIVDDKEFAWAMVQYVCERVAKGHLATLTPAERLVDLVVDCEFRLLRGGITDFLLQAHERDAALAALVTIGATRIQGVLRRGADLFDGIPSQKAVKALSIDELVELAGRDALDALSRQLGDIEEMSELARRWIAQHRSAFATD